MKRSDKQQNRQSSENDTERAAETLLALRRGDQSAFQDIYLQYFDALLGFLTKLTGSASVSEDIIQDVFSKIWETRETIDPERNFKSYLYTIARNTALNYLRGAKRFAPMPAACEELSGGQDEADQEVITRETALLVEIALGNMPRRRGEVFRAHQEGLSYGQIAMRFGITEHNARKYVMRARGDIRKLVRLIIFFLVT